MWWQELDASPSTEQLRSWALTRARGRFRYLWRGILCVTLTGVGIWFTAKLIALWLFAKEFDLTSGIPLLPVFPVVAWLVLRVRWRKNEERYAERSGGGPV